MKQFLMLACLSMMISKVTIAEETTETCANGAGTVITGAVTGHKYCKSNNTMNWWNAVAWCDGLEKKLFNLSDCECSNVTANCSENGKKMCAELIKVGSQQIWTSSFARMGYVNEVTLYEGAVSPYGYPELSRANGYFALCK